MEAKKPALLMYKSEGVFIGIGLFGRHPTVVTTGQQHVHVYRQL